MNKWIFLTIGFGLFGLFLLIKHYLYRRQIQAICRQLEFMEAHETNKRVQTDHTTPEILELARCLNDIYDSHSRQQLDAANKSRRMKQALTSISHDIRTPLTSLKGYFQLLLSAESPEKRQTYAAVIDGRINELSTLLEELFTYTKLQNEEYTLEPALSDVTKLALETLFSFYEEFKKKGITPEIQVDETPRTGFVNDSAYKRILSNIIRNALIHGNGTIAITYHMDNDAVYFTCENTVAAPEEIDMEQIFDRFYKADSARSRQSSGLGLAIANELAKRLGGSLEATLKDNLFLITFRLPVPYTTG